MLLRPFYLPPLASAIAVCPHSRWSLFICSRPSVFVDWLNHGMQNGLSTNTTDGDAFYNNRKAKCCLQHQVSKPHFFLNSQQYLQSTSIVAASNLWLNWNDSNWRQRALDISDAILNKAVELVVMVPSRRYGFAPIKYVCHIEHRSPFVQVCTPT